MCAALLECLEEAASDDEAAQLVVVLLGWGEGQGHLEGASVRGGGSAEYDATDLGL